MICMVRHHCAYSQTIYITWSDNEAHIVRQYTTYRQTLVLHRLRGDRASDADLDAHGLAVNPRGSERGPQREADNSLNMRRQLLSRESNIIPLQPYTSMLIVFRHFQPNAASRPTDGVTISVSPQTLLRNAFCAIIAGSDNESEGSRGPNKFPQVRPQIPYESPALGFGKPSAGGDGYHRWKRTIPPLPSTDRRRASCSTPRPCLRRPPRSL